MAKALRTLSQAAFEAAIGWKLMYLTCGEPRQFWAWQDEQELAFVFAERARVEEAGVVQIPQYAESKYKPLPLRKVEIYYDYYRDEVVSH